MDEKFEVTSSNTKHHLTNTWLSFGDIVVNELFFTRGIVMVSPSQTNETTVSNVNDSFVINEREFTFHCPGQHSEKNTRPDSRAIKKAASLLTTLTNFALTNNIDINPVNEKSIVLFNKRRREETFLPLTFGESAHYTGLYLYPWVAKPGNKVIFSGFTQFVTAGCLFGGAMRAIANDGEDLELINHHIQLKPLQKITAIRYDAKAGNPFEQILFQEFEKTCLLIKAFTRAGQPPGLLYHLPAYDYVLFGLELFIRNQMTYEALENFIQTIFAKREEYKTYLGGLCQKHGITVKFQSPFDNLFGEVASIYTVETLFAHLKLTETGMMAGERYDEHQLVKQCLSLLATNTHVPHHQAVWQEFMAFSDNIPDNLEGLFKMANAVMIATSSRGRGDYETCSLLPLSEKQIQVQYESWRDKLKTNHTPYPATLNITTFEPVVAYAPTTKGLIFYLACGLQSLSTLISDKKATTIAAQNIGLFAKNNSNMAENKTSSINEKPIPLHQIISPTNH